MDWEMDLAMDLDQVYCTILLLNPWLLDCEDSGNPSSTLWGLYGISLPRTKGMFTLISVPPLPD